MWFRRADFRRYSAHPIETAHFFSPFQSSGLRGGHYIQYDWGEEALYDMSSDPRQEHNVAAEQTKLLKEFRREVRDWRSKMAKGAPGAS